MASEQTPEQIAAAIVRRELDAYYVSPRPMSQQAERFDLREAIADAVREARTSGAASRDGEVKDWPWVDASKAHPQHGLSVAIIPEGDERIAVGFWDQELAHTPSLVPKAYIVDGPNGSHHVRALWWAYLPPKPSALAPGNGGEVVKMKALVDAAREALNASHLRTHGFDDGDISNLDFHKMLPAMMKLDTALNALEIA